MEELVGIGGSGLMSTDEKISAAQEIYQLRDELVNIGNTVYNGQYIFGGYNTTKPPFEVDGNGGITFNGIDLTTDSAALTDAASEVIEYKIGTSSNFPTTINGAALFGTGKDNLYSMLNDLADAMSDPNSTVEDITPYTSKVADALEHNLTAWTDVGARSSRVALVKERFETNYQNLEEKRSDIEDIDEEKTITNYKFAYAAYEAALQVGAQIMQQSLLDYLS
jgi:flagellar hook-associated protein 3 FlgL